MSKLHRFLVFNSTPSKNLAGGANNYLRSFTSLQGAELWIRKEDYLKVNILDTKTGDVWEPLEMHKNVVTLHRWMTVGA